MATDPVIREKTARTPIGTVIGQAANDSETSQASATSLATALSQAPYTARVRVHSGNYTTVKWYKADGTVFTTYKSKDGFTNAKALQFLNTMIDIRAGTLEPTSVSVAPTSSTKAPAATQQLTPTVLPAQANQAVTYTSSDITKATVNASGLVTAVATGSAVITVTTASGPIQTATYTMTIS